MDASLPPWSPSAIPVLLNHDAGRLVGHIDLTADGAIVTFGDTVSLTKEKVFEVLGNVGMQVLEYTQADDGRQFIRRARIVEWSVSTAPLGPRLVGG